MEVSFVKDVNGKVLVTVDGVVYAIDSSASIIPLAEANKVAIRYEDGPAGRLIIDWQDVTTPSVTDRNDLVEQLAADFFFRVVPDPGAGTWEELTGKPFDENNILLPDNTPAIAIEDIVEASETSIAAFAAASAGYTFQQGDLIKMTDTDSSVLHYFYKGGTKTNVASYSKIDATKIDWTNILSKPLTFPPEAHNHDAAYSALGHNHDASYAPLSHNHTGLDTFYKDVTGSYASAPTFTFAGNDNDCHKYLESLFTCLSALTGNLTITSSSGLLFDLGSAHGQITGTVCYFSGDVLPTGITAGVPYFMVKIAANTFKVSTTPDLAYAGTVVAYTNAGTNVKVKFLKVGYISALVNASGTITATVQSNVDLANGDNTFMVSTYLKVDRFMQSILTGSVELVVDASNSQGRWIGGLSKPSYILPVSAGMQLAATTTCTYNVYQDANACMSSNANCNVTASGTGAVAYVTSRANSFFLAPTGTNISIRVMSQTGTAGRGLEVKIPIIPISRFLNS